MPSGLWASPPVTFGDSPLSEGAKEYSVIYPWHLWLGGNLPPSHFAYAVGGRYRRDVEDAVPYERKNTMKYPKGAYRVGRFIGYCLTLVGCFFFGLLSIAMAGAGVLDNGFFFILAFGLFWLSFAYFALSEWPCLEFTEEGIFFRVLFWKRYYRWEEIQQAGILWRRGKNSMYNELVLLTPKGSRRKYKDKFFLLRNPFTVIKVAYYNKDIHEFVVKHYGPLDFDLSDGRDEQSVVVD